MQKLELIIRSGTKVLEDDSKFVLLRRRLAINAQDGRIRLEGAVMASSGVVQGRDCICCEQILVGHRAQFVWQVRGCKDWARAGCVFLLSVALLYHWSEFIWDGANALFAVFCVFVALVEFVWEIFFAVVFMVGLLSVTCTY